MLTDGVNRVRLSGEIEAKTLRRISIVSIDNKDTADQGLSQPIPTQRGEEKSTPGDVPKYARKVSYRLACRR